ncbi:ScbR family autoregulator-binding transcription factor [Microbacterium sp.]|uniref:ScbR family autoregulator-binding transcription factor n=1 Tax=Microbacterium sp. TaxID=51671 RepID=UPI003A873A75
MTMQARAVETRRAIIQAAADAFVQHGFAGASLAEIATQARVTKGALYFHFPSKIALAEAMIQTQREVNEAFEEYVRHFQGTQLELLINMTRLLARRLQEDTTLQAAMRLAVERGSSENPHIFATYQIWERSAAGVIAAGQERGEITRDADGAALARFLVAAFTGIQTISLVEASLSDLDERLDEMWQLLRPRLEPS